MAPRTFSAAKDAGAGKILVLVSLRAVTSFVAAATVPVSVIIRAIAAQIGAATMMDAAVGAGKNMLGKTIEAKNIVARTMTTATIAAAGSNRTDRPNNLWNVQ